MMVVAAMLCIVVAMLIVTVMGAAALRRKNAEIDRLRRQKPIDDKTWRSLNVIDRCDFTAGCHARSHETGCVRGRVVGPFINQQPEGNHE